jgi:hypothetical protein
MCEIYTVCLLVSAFAVDSLLKLFLLLSQSAHIARKVRRATATRALVRKIGRPMLLRHNPIPTIWALEVIKDLAILLQ